MEAPPQKTAGVFLYTLCPVDSQSSKKDSQEYCGILLKKGSERFFGAIEGLVGEGEKAEATAVKEAISTLGYTLNFDVSDLEKDINHPTQIMKLREDFEGSTHTLFFKQIPPTTAQGLLTGIQNGKTLQVNEGKDLPVAVALIPLSQILSYTHKKTPLTVNSADKKFFAQGAEHKADSPYVIELSPILLRIFSQNEKDHAGKQTLSWLRWVQGKPRTSDIIKRTRNLKAIKEELGEGLAPESEEKRRTELGIQEGLGERYRVKNANGNESFIHREQQVKSPENLTFTATEAHVRLLVATLEQNDQYLNLQATPLRNVLDVFYEKYAENGMPGAKGDRKKQYEGEDVLHSQFSAVETITPKMRQDIEKVIDQERDHKGDYVLYHALNHFNAFAMDLLTALREELSGNPESINFGRTWDDGFSEQNIHTLQHVFKISEESGSFLHDPFRKVVLCSNPALFSNNGAELEYSLRYWLQDFSHIASGGFDAIRSAFESIGLGEGSIKVAFKTYQTWEKEGLVPKYGRLLQIFIDPTVIDKIAFMGNGGQPLHLVTNPQNPELSKPSHILYKMRMDPKAFEEEIMKNAKMSISDPGKVKGYPNTNFLQMRFLAATDITSKDMNVATHIYDFNDERNPEQKEEYKNNLRKLVKEFARNAYRVGLKEFKFKGEEDSPKNMLEFEKKYPSRVKRIPSRQTLLSWIDGNNTKEIIHFVNQNPEKYIHSVVEEHDSAFGRLQTTLLPYLVNNKKWDIFVDLLNGLEEKILLEGMKDSHHEIAELWKSGDDEIFQKVLLALQRHEVPEDFYSSLTWNILNNSGQNHLLRYKYPLFEKTMKLLSSMIENGLINAAMIVENSIKNEFSLSPINWLLKEKGIPPQKEAEKGCLAFLKNLRLSPYVWPDSNYYSFEKSRKWHEELQYFLNRFPDLLNEVGEDFDENFREKGNMLETHHKKRIQQESPPTPEALSYVQDVFEKIDHKRFPHIANYLKSFLDDYTEKKEEPVVEGAESLVETSVVAEKEAAEARHDASSLNEKASMENSLGS